MPVPDRIRDLRDQIFATGGLAHPMAQGDPGKLMQLEAARVRLVNNSNTADLDARSANYLTAQGMNVTERSTTGRASSRTTVVVYSPQVYALRYLIDPLGLIKGGSQIVFKPDPAQSVDLEIRLGNDWAGKLPAGY
jgi:hypothetical protein